MFYFPHINSCNFRFCRCRLRNSPSIAATQKVIQIYSTCSIKGDTMNSKDQRRLIIASCSFTNQHMSIQYRSHSILDGACDCNGIFVFKIGLEIFAQILSSNCYIQHATVASWILLRIYNNLVINVYMSLQINSFACSIQLLIAITATQIFDCVGWAESFEKHCFKPLNWGFFVNRTFHNTSHKAKTFRYISQVSQFRRI